MKNKSYCVYLLNKPNSTIYKIGYTSALKKRIRTLGVQRSCSLLIMDVIYVDFRLLAVKVEEHLHDALAEYSIGYEWFDIPNIDRWDAVATDCVVTAAESVFAQQYARVGSGDDLAPPPIVKREKLNWLDYLDRRNLRDSVVSFDTYLKAKKSHVKSPHTAQIVLEICRFLSHLQK